MNVAYLDPPYSRYFHKLAARLVQPSGGSVVALLSCPAYRLYAGGDRAQVWEPGVPAQEHVLPQAFERAGWAQPGSPAFGRAFSHAVEWFKERFAAERIDICLVFSVDPYALKGITIGGYDENKSPEARNARPFYHLFSRGNAE